MSFRQHSFRIYPTYAGVVINPFCRLAHPAFHSPAHCVFTPLARPLHSPPKEEHIEQEDGRPGRD